MSSRETATKILVIDDGRASLLGIKPLLEPLGHEVLLADYTEDALMRALTQEIAVVIADVRKPRLDGVRTLARLCNRPGASGTPILCVGGFRHEAAEAYRASELNATDEIRSIYPDRTIVAEFHGDLVGKWDVDRLGQVLSNLVGNAVEHGAGEVTVHVEGSEDHVTLTVHNWGSPISSELLPDLYKPFHRGERSARGLGLGLYIVHESLRAHGGTIAARSSATEGTTFIARWPRVIDPPEVARALPSAST